MTSPQKTGVVLGGVALVCWSIVAVAVALTPRDEGANIGAGLFGLLALPLSVVAAVLLIRGSASTPPRAAAAASIAFFVGFFALAWGYEASGVLIAVLLVAIAALCVSLFLVVTSRPRPRP